MKRLFMPIAMVLCFWGQSPTYSQTVRRVPEEHASIQAAVDAAVSGDTIVIADGLHQENVVIPETVEVTLGSHYLLDLDSSHIAATVLRDSGTVIDANRSRFVGLTIESTSSPAVESRRYLYLSHCRITTASGHAVRGCFELSFCTVDGNVGPGRSKPDCGWTILNSTIHGIADGEWSIYRIEDSYVERLGIFDIGDIQAKRTQMSMYECNEGFGTFDSCRVDSLINMRSGSGLILKNSVCKDVLFRSGEPGPNNLECVGSLITGVITDPLNTDPRLYSGPWLTLKGSTVVGPIIGTLSRLHADSSIYYPLGTTDDSMIIGDLKIRCSDMRLNVDSVTCAECSVDTAQFINANPLFCSPETGDYTLSSGSPALPANNACGVQMGAFGQGCERVPDILHVPGQFATVQSAVDYAITGDTIILDDGRYHERVRVAEGITIGSNYLLDGDTNHCAQTIISSDGLASDSSNCAVISCIGAEMVNWVGLTLVDTCTYGSRVWSQGGGVNLRACRLELAGIVTFPSPETRVALDSCYVEGNLAFHGNIGNIRHSIIKGRCEWYNNAITCHVVASSIDEVVASGLSQLMIDGSRVTVLDVSEGIIEANDSEFGEGIYMTNSLDPSRVSLSNCAIGEIENRGSVSRITATGCIIRGETVLGDSNSPTTFSHLTHQFDSCTMLGTIRKANGMSLRIYNSILYSSDNDTGLIAVHPCSLLISCSILYGFDEPLMVSGTIRDTSNILIADPLFCSPETGNYTLFSASPALPANNACGVLMGAFGQGCEQSPGILHVPLDYPTIQAAIDAAVDGDTVLVADGEYIENIDLTGKLVVLCSYLVRDGDSSHISNTVIDVTSIGGSAMLTNRSTIVGITFRGGYGPVIGGADIRLNRCTVYAEGGGIEALLGGVFIDSCSVVGQIVNSHVVNTTELLRVTNSVVNGIVEVNGVHFTISGSNISSLSCYDARPTISNCTFGAVHFDECFGSISSSMIDSLSVIDGSTIVVEHSRCREVSVYALEVSHNVLTFDWSLITGSIRNPVPSADWVILNHTTAVGPIVGSFAKMTFDSSIYYPSGWVADSFSVDEFTAHCSDVRVDFDAISCPTCVVDTADVINHEPHFCDPVSADYTLMENSPALPANNACGVLMGAFGQGCERIPRILNVPTEFLTIQAAVDYAIDGDTVSLSDGHYFERPRIDKNITVGSHYILDNDTSHVIATIVDADTSVLGSTGELNTFIVQGTFSCSIIGLTIKNGLGSLGGGSDHPEGKAVLCINAFVILSQCITQSDYLTIEPSKSIYVGSTAGAILLDCKVLDGGAAFERGGGEIYRSRIVGSAEWFEGGIGKIRDSHIDTAWCGGNQAVDAKNSVFDVISGYEGMFTLDSCVVNDKIIASYFGSDMRVKNSDIGGILVRNEEGNNPILLEHSIVRGTIDLGQAGGGFPEPTYQFFGSTLLGHILLGKNTLLVIDSSILYGTPGLPAVSASGQASIDASCSVVYGYDSLLACSGCTLDTANIFFTNPLFCSPETGDYTLSSTSPALPANNACGVLMGAFGQGCVRMPGILHVPLDYHTIQAAIDASVDGDTVLVEPGTYNERVDFLGKQILVCSRFTIDGDSTHIQNTIVDGDTTVLGLADTSSVVRFVHAETSTSILEGITVTNGFGTLQDTLRYGGGIFCWASYPTIRDCRIWNNVSDLGRGIALRGGAAPLLRGLEIRENKRIRAGIRRDGGAIFIGSGNLKLTRSRVVKNEGPGVFYNDISYGLIDSCDIDSNSSFAVTADVSQLGTVKNSRIRWNAGVFEEDQGYWRQQANSGNAPRPPGNYFNWIFTGLLVEGNDNLGWAGDQSWFGFQSCTFLNNGHGFKVDSDGAIDFRDCLVSGNDGSLVTTGYDYAYVRAWNSAFVGNTGESGGVFNISSRSAYLTLDSCSFINNESSNGAVIFATGRYGQLTIRNSLFVTNTGSPVLVHDTAHSPAPLTVECSNIFANSSGDWVGSLMGLDRTSGNLSVDPLFCDTSISDYRLYNTSPCLPDNNSCGVQMGAFGQGCVRVPGILHVPGQFATVQSAVDNAIGGDTIILDDGTYHQYVRSGNIVIGSRYLLDGDTNHIGATIIANENAGAPPDGNCAVVNANQTSWIGLTIRETCGGSPAWAGSLTYNTFVRCRLFGDVLFDRSSVLLDSCYVNGNHQYFGGVGHIRHSHFDGKSHFYNSAIWCDLDSSYIRSIVASGVSGLRLDSCVVDTVESWEGQIEADQCVILERVVVPTNENTNTMSFTNCDIGEFEILSNNTWIAATNSIVRNRSVLGLNATPQSYYLAPHMFSGCTVLGGIEKAGEIPLELMNCIVFGDEAGNGITAVHACSLRISCSEFYGFDEVIVAPGSNIDSSNVYLTNPLFCSPETGDYTLSSTSPALPTNNACGVQMGAFGQGCENPIFALLAPIDTSGWPVFTVTPTYTWTAATSPDPLATVRYKIEISDTSDFSTAFVRDSLSGLSFVTSDLLVRGKQYYWRVTAWDANTLEITTPPASFWTWLPGDIDHSHVIDITDLKFIIDYFFSGAAIQPSLVGDLTGDCTIDISDLQRQIDFLFFSGPAAEVGCQAENTTGPLTSPRVTGHGF